MRRRYFPIDSYTGRDNDMLKQEEKIQISLKRVRDIYLSHHHGALAFETEDCKRS
jgi:hypothetical protein